MRSFVREVFFCVFFYMNNSTVSSGDCTENTAINKMSHRPRKCARNTICATTLYVRGCPQKAARHISKSRRHCTQPIMNVRVYLFRPRTPHNILTVCTVRPITIADHFHKTYGPFQRPKVIIKSARRDGHMHTHPHTCVQLMSRSAEKHARLWRSRFVR